MASITPSFLSDKQTTTYALPERMLWAGMHIVLALSGGVAVLNAYIYLRDSNLLNASIELARLAAIVGFWGYGFLSRRYDIGMNGGIIASWVGICCLMLAQGGVMSGNLIWSLIFGPILIVTGTIRLGIAVCVMTVGVIFGAHYWDYLLPNDFIFTPFRRTLSAAHVMVILGIVSWIVTRWRIQIIDQVNAQHMRTREADLKKSSMMIQLNHELRNPLGAIQTAVELLDREKMDEERHAYVINSIKASTSHLLSVINDVLDLEKITAGNQGKVEQEFSVRKLVTDVAEIFEVKAATNGSNLKIRLESDLHDAWNGQELRLRQVLINLTGNAIKYAPGCDITLSVSSTDNGLLFEVEDNGPGISDEIMSKLFVPFMSTSSMSGNTGLGLHICKVMVEETMGGSIHASHARNGGVVFSVKVPLEKLPGSGVKWEYMGHGLAKVDVAEVDPYANLAGRSIVVIEDDDQNSTLFAMALEAKGMLVDRALTSQEARTLIGSKSFDFALVDCSLGDASMEDGMEITPALLQSGVKCVVGLTGNASKDVEERWAEIGATQVILKPATMEKILGSLSEMAGKIGAH